MAKQKKPIQPNQMIQAASIVGGSGSPDDLRAAYQLLAASTANVQAELVRVYTYAEQELSAEIARLRDKDLVTVHAQAAKQRVSGILEKLRMRANKLCTALARVGIIQGKLQGEIRNKNKARVDSESEACAVALENMGCERRQSKGLYHMIVTEQAKTLLFHFVVSADSEGRQVYTSIYLNQGETLDKASTDDALKDAYIEIPARRLVVSKRVDKAYDNKFLSQLEKMASRAIRHNSPGGTTAFELSKSDHENVERILHQMLGKLEAAIDSTQENINAQIDQAANRARAIDPNELPQNEAVAQVHISNPDDIEAIDGDEKPLSDEIADELETNPEKAKNKLLLESKEHILYMKRKYVIGRREQDVLRQKTLAELAKAEATGGGSRRAAKGLIESLLRNGVVAFQDRSGRRWSLGAYSEMACRTGSRQVINIGELYSDEEHDLYYIVPRNSNCPICSKYEGRVYSRSGKDPRFPALYKAFGKIDPNGEDSIENTYVSIHPNCRHALARWNEITKTPQEIAEIQEKSNKPFDIDQRTEVQIKEYKEKERWQGVHDAARKKYREFAAVLGYSRVGRYPAFEKHYIDKDVWYKTLEAEYKEKLQN